MAEKDKSTTKEEPRAARHSQIGLYRSGITTPERLEATTIAREEMLKDLLEKLERSASKKTHQHFAFIGPRGVGKTHFLSLLVHRIETSKSLSKKFAVVRFPEETHRLLSFADFLLRICEILAQANGDSEWEQLYADLAEEDDDQQITDTLEPKLNGYRKQTGRTLLLLVENLDEILTRQIKDKRDIHHLRSFLLTSPSCILVATAPIMFPGLTDVKQPLYDFFDVQVLESLSQQETLDAIRANLQFDDRHDLLARFGELSPKIKALHEMTGGNPRLVMMHYALIVDEDVLEVKQQFEELLDKISPFYQDRIKDLSPQERAVLETMALIRKQPKTPALIAKRLRKSPQQTSSLLKRLTKSGYLVVMDHPKDKRSKLYRIKEGFFDIWLSMNKSRKQRQRLPALTEFFELWYEREEREQRRHDLIDRLLAADASPRDKVRSSVALDHLSDAGTDDEKIAAKLRTASAMKKSGRTDDTGAYLDEVKALKPRGVIRWLTDHRELWTEGTLLADPIRRVDEMIACWELQRAGDLEEFATRLLSIGRSLQGVGLHEALAELLLASADQLEDPGDRIRLLLQAARSQKIMGDLVTASETLDSTLQLARDTKQRRLEGTTLNNISQIYDARGDYDRALEYLEQSLAIRREIGDRSGEGTTLNNISNIYNARGDYDRALEYLEQSLAIGREIGDRSGEGTTLNNISNIYYARGDYDRALEYLEQSLAIGREIGDRSGEGTTLNNISNIYYARGDYDRALEYLEQSLAIGREIGDRSGEGTTLNNISNIYYARGDYDRALEYLEQSLAIGREIGDRSGEGTTLNNISQIYDARGDYDRALEYLEQSLAIRREIGDEPGLHVSLFNLGKLHQAKNEIETARSAFLAAYQVAKKIGDPPSLNDMDQLAKDLGNEEGLEYWESLLSETDSDASQ